MTANWTSCSGVQSTFAPKSNTNVMCPSFEGMNLAMAGRSMPGMVFSTKRAVAISAPVLPADTAACAKPSLTWLTAPRIEESFLFFKADCGCSSISTTCVAGMTSILSMGAAADDKARTIAASSPTISRRASACRRRKDTAPGTVTDKPASPPIASTAKVIIGFPFSSKPVCLFFRRPHSGCASPCPAARRLCAAMSSASHG